LGEETRAYARQNPHDDPRHSLVETAVFQTGFLETLIERFRSFHNRRLRVLDLITDVGRDQGDGREVREKENGDKKGQNIPDRET
jgi:hypothetical protein